MLSNQPGTIFDEFAVFMVESSKKVTIDIEFADDFVTGEHWHDDLRLGFDGAGEIAGVTIDIIHDDCLAGRSCRPSNALVKRNARVWRHRTLERT